MSDMCEPRLMHMHIQLVSSPWVAVAALSIFIMDV